MNEPPPYPIPQPTSDPASLPQARLEMRLVAVIMDAIIVVVPVLIIGLLSAGRLPAMVMQILFLGAYTAINWSHLEHGQTIGKKMFKLKIVRKDGSPADRMLILTRRLLPVWLVGLIPYVGWLGCLADVLCIFRPGRNTLHDDFADTKVVSV